jgi:hypothetical protein
LKDWGHLMKVWRTVIKGQESLFIKTIINKFRWLTIISWIRWDGINV